MTKKPLLDNFLKQSEKAISYAEKRYLCKSINYTGMVNSDKFSFNCNLTKTFTLKVNVYKFEYDLAGNCTKAIYPDGTSTTSEYDVRGRLTAAVDQVGARAEYSYDL